MASISSKQLKPSLLVVAALLLLICTCTTRVQAARPEPGSKDDRMPQQRAALSVAGHEKRSVPSAAGVEMHQEEPEAMMLTECEDGDEREECLMRRTLVAHTDYIYTQGKHN